LAVQRLNVAIERRVECNVFLFEFVANPYDRAIDVDLSREVVTRRATILETTCSRRNASPFVGRGVWPSNSVSP